MKVHVHALAGAAIGSLVGHPAAAFTAGMASHALLDMLPHDDTTHPIDCILTTGSIAGVGAVFGAGSPEMWGAIGATVPDIEHLILHGKNRRCKVFPTHRPHKHIHHGSHAELPIISAGIALGSLAALLLLKSLRSR